MMRNKTENKIANTMQLNNVNVWSKVTTSRFCQ